MDTIKADDIRANEMAYPLGDMKQKPDIKQLYDNSNEDTRDMTVKIESAGESDVTDNNIPKYWSVNTYHESKYLNSLGKTEKDDASNGMSCISQQRVGTDNNVVKYTEVKPIDEPDKLITTGENVNDSSNVINQNNATDNSLVSQEQGNIMQHDEAARGKRFMCKICDESFANQYRVSEQKITHHGQTPHECIVCGKTFSHPWDLCAHMRIHTREKHHECNECGKIFFTKAEVKRHMVVHTGERNHKCRVCGKTWIHSHHLTRHMKTHTGEKNHECTECEKRFVTPGELKRHMKVHTKEKKA